MMTETTTSTSTDTSTGTPDASTSADEAVREFLRGRAGKMFLPKSEKEFETALEVAVSVCVALRKQGDLAGEMCKRLGQQEAGHKDAARKESADCFEGMANAVGNASLACQQVADDCAFFLDEMALRLFKRDEEEILRKGEVIWQGSKVRIKNRLESRRVIFYEDRYWADLVAQCFLCESTEREIRVTDELGDEYHIITNCLEEEELQAIVEDHRSKRSAQAAHLE